jgi:hypothetical protein
MSFNIIVYQDIIFYCLSGYLFSYSYPLDEVDSLSHVNLSGSKSFSSSGGTGKLFSSKNSSNALDASNDMTVSGKGKK